MSSLIEIKQISIGYGKKTLQENISAKIDSSSSVLVIGPNGSGKSTLLKTLACLVSAKSGEIKYDGLKNEPKSFAYLAPRFNCSFDYAVSDLLEITKGKLTEFDREIFRDFDIALLLEKKLSNLSTGELQRVLIITTLIQEKTIFFLDEPFQNLDIQWVSKFITLFKKLNSVGKTIIFSSHNFENFIYKFDQIFCLNSNGTTHFGKTDKLVDSNYLSEAFGQKTQNLSSRHFGWENL